MSSRNKLSNSSSEDMINEKKRKRMISNRESAKRSRMKREQHVKDLNDQIMYFTNKRSEIIHKISEITPLYERIESENGILRLQREELRRRLESLDTVSRNTCEANEPPLEILEDLFLKPWQPPFQSRPIMTSAGIFRI
ncbi:bZIP transcription factor 53-like [Olea europaea var. sylvestris]|uniref:BZIP transcription factor 53-like n=1 Tax=Olea europaea subsp. europaea TaxID=158383 RepID=A0A8S0PIZ8_OLEEU|nr:bZIP transcription factor 53-like [Olea europaea var. sylvestris]CAA2939521.1 bZIP transcription factor 53-like [Olea europaea subsp. europaea]